MKKIMIVIPILFLLILLALKFDNVKYLGSIVANSAIISNGIVNDDAYIVIDKEYNYEGINEEVKNIGVNYPNFFKTINQANMKIPIFGDMVPQGIALMDEYILITAYDSEEKKSSLVYVLDKKGEVINTVSLGNKSHVGGIAYDKINNLIWIPDNNGILNAYLAEDFLDKTKVKYKYRFNDVGNDLIDFLDETKKLIAFVTIDEENIYIGNFSKDDASIVKKYRIINIEGKVSLNYVNSFMVPARTQSITFFNKGNKKFMIMSNSYQRRKSSYIKVCEYQESITNYDNILMQIELPPMLEQIATSSNSLYTIFESKALKYSNCPEKIGYICILDIYKLLEMIK